MRGRVRARVRARVRGSGLRPWHTLNANLSVGETALDGGMQLHKTPFLSAPVVACTLIVPRTVAIPNLSQG